LRVAKIRISYNAPVVLTFTLLAVVVFLLPKSVIGEWFTTHGRFDGFSSYVALFGSILGHGSWDHLLGNFMLILLIGPILEERVGSLSLLIMILITALVAGLVGTALGQASLGASGIVFMMILLASTANIRKGEIPLTFIAVALIYLGGEIYAAVQNKDDHISHLGHLCGGITGAAFGFIGARAKGADPTTLGEKPIKAALPQKKRLLGP
jgi:GlpG protein